MISIFNLGTTIFSLLVHIAIVRATTDLVELDKLYTAIQIALAFSGYFSIALVYNLVPRMIEDKDLLERVTVLSNYFFLVATAIALSATFEPFANYSALTVIALAFSLVGLALDGALLQSRRMLSRAVFFQMCPQITILFVILLFGENLLLEYSLSVHFAYAVSHIASVQCDRNREQFQIRRVNAELIVLMLRAMLAGVGSSIFSMYSLFDVHFSARMPDGSLAILALAQRFLFSTTNFLTYARFLESSHNFNGSGLKSPKENLKLVLRHLIRNTFTFIAVILIAYAGIKPIVLIFGIHDRLNDFWRAIVEMLPGIFFMIQSSFLLRFLKSARSSLRVDYTLALVWSFGYIISFHIMRESFDTLAFCYSFAWAVTFFLVVVPAVSRRILSSRD